MTILYVVATPIGNLEDITLRALRVLQEVGVVASEDTRTTRKLLQRYKIHKPLISYHQHSGRDKLQRLLERLESEDVALVTEAGTPSVSDPGNELVRAAVAKSITVTVVPGPSAITAALAVSGMTGDQFVFLGFLPRRKSERRELLRSVDREPKTLVAFEAPHRFPDAIKDILEVLGDRPMVVCRELTKVHEEVFRGPVSVAMDHFTEPRGEFTLVIEGAAPAALSQVVSQDEIIEELRRLRRQGASAQEAVSHLVQTSGMSKKEIYRLWLKVKSASTNDETVVLE